MSHASKKETRPKSSENKAQPKSHWTRVRENFEAVCIAVILALIIRHFSLEAFEIPTGSMAPGLHGVHVQTECPNCATMSHVGIDTNSMTGKVDPNLFTAGWVHEGPCPECGGWIEDVPDGVSLAEEIPVDHQVQCAVCSTYRVGSREGYRKSQAFGRLETWCPECDLEYRTVFEPSDCLGGHKILVNKFLYQVREPRRWEVIVFKFNRQRNYIKRLVGLPGEKIQVLDGDLWINGSIERKPEWAQREMWQQVHDSRTRERRPIQGPAWREVEGKGWTREENGVFVLGGVDEPSAIQYQRPIRDIYTYNSAKIRHGTSVRDLRIETIAQVNAGAGSMILEIVNGPDVYRCVLPAGDDSSATEATIERTGSSEENPTVLARVPGVRLRTLRATEVAFSIADRQLVLHLDGEIVSTTPLDVWMCPDCAQPGDGVPCQGRGLDRDLPTRWHRQRFENQQNTAGIRAERVGVRLEHVRLLRDIHYTWLNRPGRKACEVPYWIPPHPDVIVQTDGTRLEGRVERSQNSTRVGIEGPSGEVTWVDGQTIHSDTVARSEAGYFAMGDNSPSSLDSRAWGHVPRANMLGRAFAVFWPALPWRWEIGFIR